RHADGASGQGSAEPVPPADWQSRAQPGAGRTRRALHDAVDSHRKRTPAREPATVDCRNASDSGGRTPRSALAARGAALTRSVHARLLVGLVGRREQRAGGLLHQVRLDERIDVAVEHAVDVAGLLLGAQVLHQLVRLQDVIADLRTERDVALLAAE